MECHRAIARSLLPAAALLVLLSASLPAPCQERAFDDGGVLMIPAAAFDVAGFDPDGHEFWAAVGYYRGSDATAGCIKAPVYLPRYAEVTGVSATVYDNADPQEINIHLNRLDKDGGAVVTMAELSTAGQSGSLQYPEDVSIQEPTIAFGRYAYYVATCLNSPALRLYGVTIEYRPVLFSDDFESGTTGGWSDSN